MISAATNISGTCLAISIITDGTEASRLVAPVPDGKIPKDDSVRYFSATRLAHIAFQTVKKGEYTEHRTYIMSKNLWGLTICIALKII